MPLFVCLSVSKSELTQWHFIRMRTYTGGDWSQGPIWSCSLYPWPWSDYTESGPLCDLVGWTECRESDASRGLKTHLHVSTSLWPLPPPEDARLALVEGVGTHTENKGHVSLTSSQGMPRRPQTCEKARISRTADAETVGLCRTPLKSGAVSHIANSFKSILLGHETANSNHSAYMYISIQANVERRTTQT